MQHHLGFSKEKGIGEPTRGVL